VGGDSIVPHFDPGIADLVSVHDAVGYQLTRTFVSLFSCSFEVRQFYPS
jgi:hypothetical protein